MSSDLCDEGKSLTPSPHSSNYHFSTDDRDNSIPYADGRGSVTTDEELENNRINEYSQSQIENDESKEREVEIFIDSRMSNKRMEKKKQNGKEEVEVEEKNGYEDAKDKERDKEDKNECNKDKPSPEYKSRCQIIIPVQRTVVMNSPNLYRRLEDYPDLLGKKMTENSDIPPDNYEYLLKRIIKKKKPSLPVWLTENISDVERDDTIEKRTDDKRSSSENEMFVDDDEVVERSRKPPEKEKIVVEVEKALNNVLRDDNKPERVDRFEEEFIENGKKVHRVVEVHREEDKPGAEEVEVERFSFDEIRSRFESTRVHHPVPIPFFRTSPHMPRRTPPSIKPERRFAIVSKPLPQMKSSNSSYYSHLGFDIKPRCEKFVEFKKTINLDDGKDGNEVLSDGIFDNYPIRKESTPKCYNYGAKANSIDWTTTSLPRPTERIVPPPKPARKAHVIPYQKTNHGQARSSRNQYPSTENHIETMRIKRSKLIGYRPVFNGVDKISDKERKRRKWPKKMLSDMPSSGLDFNRAADSDSAYQSDCRLEKEQLDIKYREDRLSIPEIRLQLYGAGKAESKRISTLNTELKKSWQDTNSDVSKIFRRVDEAFEKNDFDREGKHRRKDPLTELENVYADALKRDDDTEWFMYEKWRPQVKRLSIENVKKLEEISRRYDSGGDYSRLWLSRYKKDPKYTYERFEDDGCQHRLEDDMARRRMSSSNDRKKSLTSESSRDSSSMRNRLRSRSLSNAVAVMVNKFECEDENHEEELRNGTVFSSCYDNDSGEKRYLDSSSFDEIDSVRRRHNNRVKTLSTESSSQDESRSWSLSEGERGRPRRPKKESSGILLGTIPAESSSHDELERIMTVPHKPWYPPKTEQPVANKNWTDILIKQEEDAMTEASLGDLVKRQPVSPISDLTVEAEQNDEQFLKRKSAFKLVSPKKENSLQELVKSFEKTAPPFLKLPNENKNGLNNERRRSSCVS
ncbi:DgyrCDS9892 [Dimorphilus gyrociliatus]|uniref:DgyrCDS9892 n=1 Tax=Dimorphilus gyrociliatus TaxID=2664684 RepID=A0A7I8W3N6_9ANNE|nr:DgyrCDS9892 [Dimorphilus gyrociliatus]